MHFGCKMFCTSNPQMFFGRYFGASGNSNSKQLKGLCTFYIGGHVVNLYVVALPCMIAW